MPDPTAVISKKFKGRIAYALVMLWVGSAERLLGDQVAGKILMLSSRSDPRMGGRS